MTMHEVLAEWSRWGWPLIGNHLWQGTLAALIALVAAAFFKRAPARVRHTLWLMASIKFAVPSLLFFYLVSALGISLPSFAREASASVQSMVVIVQVAEPMEWQGADSISGPALNAPPPDTHNEIFCALTVVWLLGCGGVLFVWWRKRRDFSRAMKDGEICAHGREYKAVARVRSWLGIRRRVDLITTPGLTEPGVMGVWRPVLVLPESMSDLLTEAELEAVIMHEMVHIARWDNLSSNFQMLLCCLFWFHPVVWLIDRRLLVERERACDEQVVELSGAAKVYASSLVKVLGFCLGWKVAGVSLATGSNLQRRIEQIMIGNTGNKLALSHRIAFSAVIASVVFLSIAAGLLSRDQVIAQAVARGQGQADKSKGAVTSRASSRGGIRGGIPGGIPGGVAGGVAGGVQDGVEAQEPPQPPPEPSAPSEPAPPSAPKAPSEPAPPPEPATPSTPAPPSEAEARSWRVAPPPPPSAAGGPAFAIRPPASPAASMAPMPPMAAQEEKPESQIIKRVEPEYPDSAREAKVTGEVEVEIVIDEKGNVASAKAVSGPDPLKASAIKAAKKWKFKPTKIESKPVKVKAVLTFDFKLD